MRKQAFIVIFFFLVNTNLNAQFINLLSNGDFEIYTILPSAGSQSNRALGWNNVNGNYMGTNYCRSTF